MQSNFVCVLPIESRVESRNMSGFAGEHNIFFRNWKRVPPRNFSIQAVPSVIFWKRKTMTLPRNTAYTIFGAYTKLYKYKTSNGFGLHAPSWKTRPRIYMCLVRSTLGRNSLFLILFRKNLQICVKRVQKEFVFSVKFFIYVEFCW